MDVKVYSEAALFLNEWRTILESNEAANGLMLGICNKLVEQPERFQVPPFLMGVADGDGPALAAMMTPPHNLVLCAQNTDLGQSVAVLVSALRQGDWHIPGVMGPQDAASEFVNAWKRETGTAFRLEQRQRVYRLDHVLPGERANGELRLATEQDLDLAALWWMAFHQDIYGRADEAEARKAAQYRIQDGDLFLWEDGQVVSMAIRTRPTRSGISVSMVYTPPELRRRGYASACVAALSQKLLDEGWKFCSLFADLANPTSNSIYQKIGYQEVCDYDVYLFEGSQAG